jgi:hypothetical protein
MHTELSPEGLHDTSRLKKKKYIGGRLITKAREILLQGNSHFALGRQPIGRRHRHICKWLDGWTVFSHNNGFINKKNFEWVRERSIPTERPPLVGEVSVQLLRIEGATWLAWRIPYGRVLGFLDRSRYVFFQAAPQLYSRGWVDPVPDTLLLRKSGSAGKRTRTSGSVARNSDH